MSTSISANDANPVITIKSSIRPGLLKVSQSPKMSLDLLKAISQQAVEFKPSLRMHMRAEASGYCKTAINENSIFSNENLGAMTYHFGWTAREKLKFTIESSAILLAVASLK